MTGSIVRPLDLDVIVLKPGSHKAPQSGIFNPDSDELCLMEAVAYMAGEPWSDHPECASPTIAAFLRRWQDDTDDAGRARLKPYIPLMIGTNTGEADENIRRWMCANWMLHTHLPAWLDVAGMADQAAAVRAFPDISSNAQLSDARDLMRLISNAAWSVRSAWYNKLRAEIRERLTKSGAVAVVVVEVVEVEAEVVEVAAEVVAVVVAAVVAAAKAAAAVVAEAEVVEAEAEVVVAAAVVVEAEVVAAVVVEAEAEVVVAAVVAAAVVAAVAEAGSSRYWEIRDAVYKAVKPIFDEKLGPIAEPINQSAFDLLDALIAVGK